VLVGVLNNNTAAIFTDTISAGLTPIPDDQGLPPDFTLITSYLDRLFLAGVPGDPYSLFFSEVGMPDVYPALNTLTCNQEDPITGIVVYLDRLVVFNRRSMGQILGKTSDSFRYAPIQSSVGCVDTRSIQIRVIEGVPVLVWLSDKGFYAYNGNSVIYISDTIEDKVNANIQQALVQRNRISHSDYSIFVSGNGSDGINLEANPGTITTKGPYWDTVAHPGATYEEQTNPKIIFDTKTEWENGTSKQNLVIDNSNSVKLPIRFSPALTDGTLSNTIIDSNSLKLNIASNYTGETFNTSGGLIRYGGQLATNTAGATRISFPRAGSITTVDIVVCWHNDSPTKNFYIRLWTDAGGNPGTVLAQTLINDITTFPLYYTAGTLDRRHVVVNVNFPPVAAGTYYIGVESVSVNSRFTIGGRDTSDTIINRTRISGGAWEWGWTGETISPSRPETITFSQTAVPNSGYWQSPIYDSSSAYITSGINAFLNATYPSGSYPSGPYSTSSIFKLEASNDPSMLSGVISEDLNSINGTASSSLTAKRYWRITTYLSTTDDRVTPILSNPQIRFLGIGVWESEVIDSSADVTVYQNLIKSTTEPTGTSSTIEIATSTNPLCPITPGTGNSDGQFGPFGSHVVRQYVKIRVTLSTNSDNTAIPVLDSTEFSWTIGDGLTTASFESDEIDTGTTPSGWDIFQASYTENGGSVKFSLRSASSQAGLLLATWYDVTVGEFPNVNLPNLQWVQWRAIIQANPDQVPTIDSVTIGWFVGTQQQGIRCASIFYNKNYYIALSEFGNDYNNLLYVLDFTGQWRLFKDINAATLSYFFNDPYYGDAMNGKVVKFLEGSSDQGNPIELEVHTKAFDGSTQWTDNDDKVKVLDHVIVNCTNTGASFDCYYSIDEGETFNPLYDTSGNNVWTTLTDGKEVFKYLRPRYDLSIPQGRSLLFKIHNNDTNEVQIKSLKAEAFVREQPPIITG
jgi:hypothetical protein